MASLLDIADAVETVTVGDKKIEVRGIDGFAIAGLLLRFPELRKLISRVAVDPMDLVAIGADVVGAIIAAGCGSAGQTKYEDKAKRLPLDAQLDFLTKIIRLTMPGGSGPFVEKLTALMAVVGQSNTAPATKSPRASKP
ncbi:hypothetical protein [Sinorhizobium americanum]|uniref:Uncharacterized protein n=1 Tax=Sinorhizobium americanum TaxID=194963 RepID=A0A4R2BU37_9HYPH|nr:hypothetical protein [Sinorhizobium americanum]TCN30343.1 hypothetical protein EV184_108217 [Sinorhizobium americanum]